jgi:hypothetical protein
MAEPEYTKVVMVTGEGEVSYVETPWVVPVSDGHFRLENIPFYAYGISLGDILEATPADDDPRPLVRRVVTKSGNRTLRVLADEGAPSVPQSLLDKIESVGCSYTGATPRYICINIPPIVPLDTVVAVLVKSHLRWEHADPTYDQLHPDEPQLPAPKPSKPWWRFW